MDALPNLPSCSVYSQFIVDMNQVPRDSESCQGRFLGFCLVAVEVIGAPFHSLASMSSPLATSDRRHFVSLSGDLRSKRKKTEM